MRKAIVVDNSYGAALRKALAGVKLPDLVQLRAAGDDLVSRVRMPEADPESVKVPDDTEEGE